MSARVTKAVDADRLVLAALLRTVLKLFSLFVHAAQRTLFALLGVDPQCVPPFTAARHHEQILFLEQGFLLDKPITNVVWQVFVEVRLPLQFFQGFRRGVFNVPFHDWPKQLVEVFELRLFVRNAGVDLPLNLLLLVFGQLNLRVGPVDVAYERILFQIALRAII